MRTIYCRWAIRGAAWRHFKKTVIAVAQIFYFDRYANRILTGLTLAETRELEALERHNPSLAEWDAYTMQPVSENERRWAYLSQKHIEAMDRAIECIGAPKTQKRP